MEDLKKHLKDLKFSVKILKNLIPISEYVKQISLILITEKTCPEAIFICGKLNQLLESSIEID